MPNPASRRSKKAKDYFHPTPEAEALRCRDRPGALFYFGLVRGDFQPNHGPTFFRKREGG